jgi:hypothetical protein
MQDHIFLTTQCSRFIDAFLNGYVSAIQSHNMQLAESDRVIQFYKRNKKDPSCNVNANFSGYSKILASKFVRSFENLAKGKVSDFEISKESNAFHYLSSHIDNFLCENDS